MIRLSILLITCLPLTFSQAEQLRQLCEKVYPTNEIYDAQVASNNRCLINCRIPEIKQIWRKDGDTCDVDSVCYKDKCMFNFKDGLELCIASNDKAKYNYAERKNSCKVNCYALPDRNPFVVNLSNDYICQNGVRSGRCQNGICIF